MFFVFVPVLFCNKILCIKYFFPQYKHTYGQLYKQFEGDKTHEYGECIRQVEHGLFTPFFSFFGGVDPP